MIKRCKSINDPYCKNILTARHPQIHPKSYDEPKPGPKPKPPKPKPPKPKPKPKPEPEPKPKPKPEPGPHLKPPDIDDPIDVKETHPDDDPIDVKETTLPPLPEGWTLGPGGNTYVAPDGRFFDPKVHVKYITDYEAKLKKDEEAAREKKAIDEARAADEKLKSEKDAEAEEKKRAEDAAKSEYAGTEAEIRKQKKEKAKAAAERAATSTDPFKDDMKSYGWTIDPMTGDYISPDGWKFASDLTGAISNWNDKLQSGWKWDRESSDWTRDPDFVPKVGTQVFAEFYGSGEYHPAEVVKVAGDKYKVEFYDFDNDNYTKKDGWTEFPEKGSKMYDEGKFPSNFISMDHISTDLSFPRFPTGGRYQAHDVEEFKSWQGGGQEFEVRSDKHPHSDSYERPDDKVNPLPEEFKAEGWIKDWGDPFWKSPDGKKYDPGTEMGLIKEHYSDLYDATKHTDTWKGFGAGGETGVDPEGWMKDFTDPDDPKPVDTGAGKDWSIDYDKHEPVTDVADLTKAETTMSTPSTDAPPMPGGGGS